MREFDIEAEEPNSVIIKDVSSYRHYDDFYSKDCKPLVQQK